MHVPRDLFADKLAMPVILIKALDHVVAVAPGVIPYDIALIPLALRKTDNVQPVPSPALAVVWRGKEAIDELLIYNGRFIVYERICFRGCRRQSNKIECCSADEDNTVGGRCGVETSGFQL